MGWEERGRVTSETVLFFVSRVLGLAGRGRWRDMRGWIWGCGR
jgi:hypothetical protein